MTCNSCIVGLAVLYVSQNLSFGFKYASIGIVQRILQLLRILKTFVAFHPSGSEVGDQRAPVLRDGLPHSWKPIHFTHGDPPPHRPKAAASEREQESPRHYRAQPCCGHLIVWGPGKPPAPAAGGGPDARRGGRAGGLGGEALVRPRRAIHGGEGRQRGAHRFLVLPVRSEAPPAGSRPGPSPPPGAIGGCWARPGWQPLGGQLVADTVREERARCRRFLLHGGRKAARPGPPCARTGERERAGPRRRRRRCGSPSLPQWGWAAERAGRGKGQAPPPRWAME